ncbi:hypothetical protein [Bacillus sp. FJAT-50079]|uniref:hypothetical protein n=1 Tax=Bacillus sp. FJAT-50079 TaxID=2833577 RepID=UPI001BC976EE|nr:hypothetical protein [Bacillus sp. FJAT-50079]MBS4207489.1 hypothetical protein [Bacillus sp. FJAT-50079]
MRKLVFMLSAILLALVACNAEEPKEKTDVKQETTSEKTQKEDKGQEEVSTEKTTVETKQEDNSQTITEEGLKETIEYYGMGEGDTLVSASLENGEIKAVINVAPSDLFSAEDLAVTRYSQLSDELLDYEGWEVLTIEYVDVGTISMQRTEKASNEYGDYFPTAEIEKRLK